MKNISVALKAHYAQEVTTLATCWKVTRVDGLIFGFTNHTRDITYSGQVYAASTGYTPANIKTTSALNVDNTEVISALDSSSITDADVLAGLWDYAMVEIFELNYADLTMGVMQLRKGWTGETKVGRNVYVTELRGLTQPLQQEVGRIYSAPCDADLGDARCGVNLALFTVTGTLTAVSGNANFTDSARAEAAGAFQYGKLTWTSGANIGLSMEVKSFSTGGVFALQQPMPYTVAVGDAYSVYKGCNKDRVTSCIPVFNNVVNFRGFDMTPGQDRMISGT